MAPWRDEFIKLVEAADGRVSPSFKPHHAAVALLMIGRQQPIGRYELCENLSIGEGSARTLLKRLTESQYVTADGKQGQRLTEKGSRLFLSVSEDIPLGMSLNLRSLVVYEHAYGNRVVGRADKVADGVRQRDEAIIQGGYGAAGATTLVHKDGVLVIPPDDFEAHLASMREATLILESLRPEDDDVIVIGSANDGNLAREVSMAAVMTLFEED
ncbi:MAG: hypothetical protein JSW61_12710 [Candidatus Thorarchaeota archaeon]|nr:MAG: hypothetical protein JSW61_12710 [Candidatus Thorarchaeota archaeon]